MRSPLPLTLGDMLEDNAHRFGDQPAWVFGGRTLTHRQFLDRARSLASALAKHGVHRQDRVAVLAMNGLEIAEVLAAGHWSGIIVATVSFRLAAPEIEYIVGNSTPRVLFFEAQYLAVVDQLRATLPTVETWVCIGGTAPWAVDYETFLGGGDAAGSPFQAREDDIACLIYTSGTTGKPKGCILGQREMRFNADRLSSEMRCGSADRGLLVMPLFHIGAMGIGHGIHFRGGRVVLHRQFDAAALLQSVREDGITVLHLAPTLVQMMLEHPDLDRTDFSRVQTLVYAAAAMPLPLLKRGIEKIGPVFVNLYGQTEVYTSGLARELHRPNGTEREKRWLLSVGHPFPNTRVKIVDDAGRECPPETPGEIVVQTLGMARGYWNNHAATLETFRDGWCHTGDIGLLDADGMLYLVDRKKDVIISGGENIYSREVEDALLTHPAVAEVAVIGIPDAKWGESVCACVVLRAGHTVTDAELVEHARSQIARYKVPRTLLFRAELPKMPTGKIDKKALRQQHAR